MKITEKIDRYLIGEAKGVYIRKVNPFSTGKKRDKFQTLIDNELEKLGFKYTGYSHNKMWYKYILKFNYKNNLIPINISFAMRDINENGTIYFKVYGNMGDFELWRDWNGWGRFHAYDLDNPTPEYYAKKIFDYITSESEKDDEFGNNSIKKDILDALNKTFRKLPDEDISKFVEYLASGRYKIDAMKRAFGGL